MWYAALILGFLGSLHCAGMCAPLVMILPLDRTSRFSSILGFLSYALGKTLTYAVLGLAFGWLGKALWLGNFQQGLSVAVGIFMVLTAAVPVLAARMEKVLSPAASGVGRLKQAMGKRLRSKQPADIFSLGMLNGLLPCGLVYMALFGALAQGEVWGSASFMIFFGLGTLPVLGVASMFGMMIPLPWRQRFLHLLPWALAVIGLLFILRGMGLGIPYLSPSEMQLMVKAQADCTLP